MWYEDLTECDYLCQEYASFLTAVGWLENGKPFQTGTIPRDVYFKLCELVKNPWVFESYRGFHYCDLCKFQFDFESAKGDRNIYIPHKGKIYICPQLITHYINTHFYLPPREFIEAVYLCPPMNTRKYYDKMVESGGYSLIKIYEEIIEK